MSDPIIEVGNEFLDSNGNRIVVASFYPNGDLKVVIYAIFTGPGENDYLGVTLSPTTTVSGLRGILKMLGVTLP